MQTPLLATLILAAVMMEGHGQQTLMEQSINHETYITMPWNSMYDDITSTQYASLKSNVETALNSYWGNVTYFHKTSVIGIRKSGQTQMYIGYLIFFMVPQGYTYDQDLVIRMMYIMSTEGLKVENPVGGQTCSPSCKNGGTCYSGSCQCTSYYEGPDCSIRKMSSHTEAGYAELKINWQDGYYNLESFEFATFNQSLTAALTREFSYIPTFSMVIVTKFFPMDMAIRRKRQAVPVMKNVRIDYILFFKSPLTPGEKSLVKSTITSIQNDGLVVGQIKYYPPTHTGCTTHLECVYGYCSNGQCICNSGYMGKWCETSTTAETEKNASVNLTMPYNPNMEDHSSFEYTVLKRQLTDALRTRFMGFPYFVRASIKEIRIHHNFRQRRQAPSQVNMKVFEIFYGVIFSQYIASGSNNDRQIDAAIKDISENGLTIFGVAYYPPGQQMNKRCDNFLIDTAAQQEVLQQCTASFTAIDKTTLSQMQICQLYHAALGCAKAILHNYGYNCSYFEMDNSPFTGILKQSHAITCPEPLPSEGSTVKSLCHDRPLMAVYAMSSICTTYIQLGNPCRFLGNVSECLANYTLCDMKNITNTLIDNPTVLRTRYNHDFTACPRPTNMVKPGKCPPAVSDTLVSCVTQCRDDSGCSGRQKCCYNGCTDKCMAPERAGTCSSDGQCYNGGTCYQNNCICMSQYTGTYCDTMVSTRDCSYDSECANGGTCHNGYCNCREGFTGTHCYTGLDYGNCSRDSDCINGGTCHNNRCLCTARYTGLYCTTYVGCSNSAECANGGTCSSGYCTCPSSYTGPYCNTRVSSYCTYNDQCANGGTCQNGDCMCAPGYAGPNCYTRLHTRNCTSDAQCHNGGTCYNYQCQCPDRYTGYDCSSYVGCMSDSECANGGSCYHSYCSCAPDFTGPYCTTRMPSYNCTTNYDCANGGTCYNGYCSCPYGYTGRNCFSQMYNTSCAYSSQCANGGTCNSGYCVCAQDYTGPHCYSRLYMRNCSSNAECYNGGTCYNYQCLCAGRYTGYDCSSYVGCTHNYECANEGTCSSGYCTCTPSYTGPYCKTRMPTTGCVNNSHCRNGGSCMQGVCMCMTGYSGIYCELYVPDPFHIKNSVTLDLAWRQDFENPSSYVYMDVKHNLQALMARIYSRQFDIERVSVTGFLPGSVIANFTAYFKENVQYKKYELKNAKEEIENSTFSTSTFGDVTFKHTVNKPGNCPQGNIWESNCRRACDSDDECWGDAKCCNNGCGTDCLAPVNVTECRYACRNGGTCMNGRCMCPPGYTGEVCERTTEVNSTCRECTQTGRCIKLNGVRVRCLCSPEYTGKYCETYLPTNETHSVQLIITLNMEWMPRYNYSNSQRKADIQKGLVTFFDDIATFKSLVVDALLPGSVVVKFTVTFSGRTTDAEIEARMDRIHSWGVRIDDMVYTTSQTFDCRTYVYRCRNGGSCNRSMNGTFECICPVYRGGPWCEAFNSGDCRASENSCVYGSCRRDRWAGDYKCMCNSGYSGYRCESWIQQGGCTYQYECMNGGSCINGTCMCRPGYSGRYCTTYMPGCTYQFECMNGGSCINDTCMCRPGYSGRYCTTYMPDGCQSDPCMNGGSCHRSFGNSSFYCQCPKYYTGMRCEKSFCDMLPMNPCDSAYGGMCKPDFDKGQLCECSGGMINGQYVTGFFCDALSNNPPSQMNTCEKVKNMSLITRKILTGKMNMMGVPNTGGLLRRVLREHGFTEIIRPECEAGGMIHKSCKFNIETPETEICYCTDYMGMKLPHTPERYNEMPTNCPPTGFQCEDYTCVNSSCYFASDRSYCACPPRYSGTYCQNYVGHVCDSNPCYNNFSCIAYSTGSYKCSCPSEWGPSCENVPYWYCNCGPMERCVRVEYCYDGPCKRKNKCVPYDYTGPCAANTCSGKGMCVEKDSGEYICECYSGYSGFNCEKNTEVCKVVDSLGVCVQGSCLGDIDGGRLCKCPRGVKGAFCEMPTSDYNPMTRCEYQAELYNTALKILRGEISSHISNAPALIRNLTMNFMNASEIPMTNCTASGDYTPQQCARNMYTMSERCYCVNNMGHEIYYNITTLPGMQPCTAPDPTDIGKIICGSPINFCQNGASCVGEILDTTPKMCDCAPGFEGIFCERKADSTEPPEEYTLCTFSHDGYKLMQSIMAGEFNMTVMGITIDKNILMMSVKQMMMSPQLMAMMSNMSTGMTPFNTSMPGGTDLSVIKANCTEDGDFEELQCEYGIMSGKRYVCYCYEPNGRPIPGTRTMAPKWPNCKMTCSSMSSCPLTCPNGYRKDMMGCPICQCKESCEGKWCMPGTRCVHTGWRNECKPTHKSGMCPMDLMPDMDGIMKLFEDTQDTCDIRCHDDADCEGDKKCCGACGNRCVAPYYARNCAAKKEIMDAHWDLHRNLSAAMKDPSNNMMMTIANKTYPAVLQSALNWIKNTKKMWRPSCNIMGEYERIQCEYDTKTNMKVKCFCADREGKRINGTDSMEPVCDVKPGSCPKNMPMNMPTTDVCRYDCESDYDCDGHDKCCMTGCNSICKKPFNESMVHPGMNMTVMFKNLCAVMTQMGVNYCSHGSECVGDWERGELCRCPSGYKGPLCEDMMKPGERMPTLCEKREGLYELATRPEYMMAVTQLLQSMNMDMLIVPKANCTDDGRFQPMQCEYDLKTRSRKFCYCVKETGHRLNGTAVRSPYMPHCEMGECKLQHMYYSRTSDKPMMCNMKYSNCPYGYMCKEVAYGRYTCCVSHHGHHDICKQSPSHGRWCMHTSNQVYATMYYYNMTMQKCMPFQYRGCHGNDNRFLTEAACMKQCVKKEKEGTCPEIAESSSKFICNNDCDNDGKCPGKRKCCKTDCGFKCLHPKIDSDDRKCRVGWEHSYLNNTPIMCSQTQRNCPAGYSCNFAENDGPSYCCPDEDKPVDICMQAKVVGPCEAAMKRYFYNRKTEQCEPFIYGGCQGNDNNFASLEACCRRCGKKDSAQCKPGQCPVPDKDGFALCANLCHTDADCQGEARCCSNGCGRSCILPPKNLTCIMKKREVLMKMMTKKDDCNFMHMPRCHLDGSWKSQQCMDSLGLCWCVDRHGRKVPNSLVRGQANCPSFIPYDRPAEEDMPNIQSKDICKGGEKVHCCNPGLCQLHVCRANPSAVCRINPCGGCKVEFFNHYNKKVDCTYGYSGCALAYDNAKKHMKQMILNKMLAMKKNPMTVNVTEIIMSHMRPKYVPDPAILPPKCSMEPETGRCRAYMPRWFYNHTSNRCEMFIYGGCGGNDNNFEKVEECYRECHEEANPCKSSGKCTTTQKCSLGVDYHCDHGPCAHWAECSYIFKEPHISGFPVPMCAGNNFERKQCHHEYCWCVNKDGIPVAGSLAMKGGVTCSFSGTFELYGNKAVTCPNDVSPSVHCINKCLGKTCAGRPNATCVVNLCDPLCEVKFMEGTEMVDCKSDECSMVHAETPEKCEVEYDCPSSAQPKLCKDACSTTKCPGNPCAKCVTDPCTCKAKFIDLLTNKTIDKCTTMMHTPCELDRCQRMMQKHKEKIATGMTSIMVPECSSTGHYLPQQCEDEACWCVDGKGESVEGTAGYHTCDRNEVEKVTVSFVFRQDFSLVADDIEGFKERLIDAIVKLSMIEGAERFITIEVTEGSIRVVADIEDKEMPDDPSPYITLIGDSLEKNIAYGNMKVSYKGKELVADNESFTRVERFQDHDDKPKPPEKRPPLSLPVIIAIAVGGGIVLVLLVSILVYCCCCSRKDSNSSSQGSQAPTEYTPDTKPYPMMVGHTNATYGVVSNPHMDNMGYQGDNDMIKVRL